LTDPPTGLKQPKSPDFENVQIYLNTTKLV
jgi:hypothetical protein